GEAGRRDPQPHAPCRRKPARHRSVFHHRCRMAGGTESPRRPARRPRRKGNPSTSTNPFRIGIVGARGHVGAELIRLLAGPPGFELAFVSSRALDGERVADHNPAYSGRLRYSAPGYAELPTLGADAVVLALPNGKAGRCVEAFDV